jgi:NOL1/NOP2/sun family putative RNA methylase
MPQPLEPLPAPFVERLRRVIPARHWEVCLASFAQRKPTAFRVNTLKATVGQVQDELGEVGFGPVPVDWREGAFLVDPQERRRLADSAAVTEGRIYIQNLSSMVAPMVLNPQPGEHVLDLAAAPGGKTLQMAAMMRNQGQIAAVEVVRARMFKLQAALGRYGATIVKTYLTDGRTVGRKTPERFDRALLDAPCSAEARFDRRDPGSWRRWSLRKIQECARKQKGLLRSGLRSLKPGGTLLYCTCSLAPEENEEIVHGVLLQLGGAVEIQPVDLPFANTQPGLVHWDGKDLHPDLVRTVRILPNHEMDAFYLCQLTKRQSMRSDRRRHKHSQRRRRPELVPWINPGEPTARADRAERFAAP